MTQKAQSLAVIGYTPGPDGATPASRGPGLGSRGRLTTSLAGAAPWQQFTPDQQSFRDNNAAGRWQADYDTGAHAPVNALRQDPTSGAVDVVRLEASNNPSGVDSYLDLGGKGGRDFAARQP
jgi:hypothetical protein